MKLVLLTNYDFPSRTPNQPYFAALKLHAL